MADRTPEEKHFYYEMTIKGLIATSKNICRDNLCTEDNHNCESIAYFDWDEDEQMYHIIDVCQPCYRTKIDDSYILLPIEEGYTVEELIRDLEDNDIREDNE